MARFFKSPADLIVWLKKNCSSAPEASAKIVTLAGSNKEEQDIVESVRRIFAGEDSDGASTVLYGILSKYEITEPEVNAVNDGMHKVVAADALLKAKEITAETHEKMVKEAQIMRQPGEYQALPLRVCPKLPKQSSGHQLISTYNCRHYCLDSIVFDDDPMRVYCAETIWRKHVMDKFSREFKNEDGEWVGGYINNRFFKFPTAGTPDNPDVPRDHGNKMQLANGERTRQPRPHEYSTERRLQEQREPGSTKSILLLQAESRGLMKLASSGQNDNAGDEKVVEIFSRLVELNNAGVERTAAAAEVVKETGWSASKIVKIQSFAVRKMKVHQADVYSIVMGKKSNTTQPNVKTAQGIAQGTNQGAPMQDPMAAPMAGQVLLQVPADQPIQAMTPNGQTTLEPETVLLDCGNNSFEIFDTDNMKSTGNVVTLVVPTERHSLIDFNAVVAGAQEAGLV
jgi:hypothetical protein